ncbi:LysM peptidoglycan-binding domain-containing protein [Pontibacter litorisediminis]|uniref:LysM peptidoglycan-binding domain-containing protein n=1 Tax=Pontibacter litorisediminis TaxID=1846260 RepID=UPI0023ECCABF|nr:LysM peptidoglycan-binding domain-containing protein [Pontibacter litorisediminis]
MLRTFLLSLVAVPVLSFSANALDLGAVRDSVGVERKSGKLFVQHKVEPKETLYALSRKYGVPVSQIVEANPSVQTTIKIGEIVLIPRGFVSVAATTPKNTAPAASNRTFTVNSVGNKLHTVEPKQTLYSVSRMYGVSVENLRFWNKLGGDNNIEIGQQLIVGTGQPTPTQKPVYMPEPDDEMAKGTDATAVASAGPTTPAAGVTPTPVAVTIKERVDEEEPGENAAAAGTSKMMESGMAEMIDAKTNDTNKYLALHKTAPVGTIMQVKNAMNGEVVYVRVIGKLPETGENERVVVRLSKKAYQKLGATDPRFRVELSYMP